jgi:hypothetical protein
VRSAEAITGAFGAASEASAADMTVFLFNPYE